MSNETKQTVLWTGLGLLALIILLVLGFALGFIG